MDWDLSLASRWLQELLGATNQRLIRSAVVALSAGDMEQMGQVPQRSSPSVQEATFVTRLCPSKSFIVCTMSRVPGVYCFTSSLTRRQFSFSGCRQIMNEAQRLFDQYAMPICPSQLTSPNLHKVHRRRVVAPMCFAHLLSLFRLVARATALGFACLGFDCSCLAFACLRSVRSDLILCIPIWSHPKLIWPPQLSPIWPHVTPTQC